MKETRNEELIRLNYENILWVIFIIGAILNIVADTLLEEFLITNDSNKEKQAKDIYVSVTILTILLYFYFLKRNYKFYVDAKMNNENTTVEFIRFIGTIFLITGASLILYSQINEPPKGSAA